MGKQEQFVSKVIGAEKAIDYINPTTGEHILPKYESFCMNYAHYFTPRLAMEAAGYPVDKKTEHAMQAAFRHVMRRDDVRMRVQSVIREKAEHLGVGQDWVVMKWMELLDRCMAATPVLDKDGDETGEWKFDSRGAGSVLHDMAAYFGMFAKAKESSKPVNITMNFGPKEKPVIEHE